jgi:methionyl-tRNA formyltransferase
LLAEMIPLWAAGEIEARPQNHDIATYTKRFEKQDGEVHFMDDAQTNLLKIRAFEGWPVAFAYFERNGKRLRVQLLDAHIQGDVLVLDTVKPEGKNAMSYTEFVRSGATPIMD